MALRHGRVAATFTLSMRLDDGRIAMSTAKEPLTRELALTDTQFGWTRVPGHAGGAPCHVRGGA